MSQSGQGHQKGIHRSNWAAHGNSQTKNQWLGSLLGISLSPLHMCVGCVVWKICQTPGSESQVYS